MGRFTMKRRHAADQARRSGWTLHPRALLGTFLLALMLSISAQPGLAAPRPAPVEQEPACQQILLRQEDMPAPFEVLGSGFTSSSGLSICERTLARTGRFTTSTEPEGIMLVLTLSYVGESPADADRAFDIFANSLFGKAGFQELSVEALTDRQRGAARWATGPYDLASTAVLFRRGRVTGLVQIWSYSAPESTSEALGLARIMAARGQL